MLGAFGDAKDATEETQTVADTVRASVEAQTGQTYTKWTATKFTSQVVAGKNLRIKVQVGDTDYIHIKVFVPLPHTGNPVELKEVTVSQTADSAL